MYYRKSVFNECRKKLGKYYFGFGFTTTPFYWFVISTCCALRLVQINMFLTNQSWDLIFNLEATATKISCAVCAMFTVKPLHDHVHELRLYRLCFTLLISLHFFPSCCLENVTKSNLFSSFQSSGKTKSASESKIANFSNLAAKSWDSDSWIIKSRFIIS